MPKSESNPTDKSPNAKGQTRLEVDLNTAAGNESRIVPTSILMTA
jgi:hypothetical protein